ncbi:MAG: divalent-cation tolerance protein CutA [Balneolaceae bacterium]|nr:MAG: divalent-cation tolerance protein CutA [Balneolaceae bacterium]
MFRNLRLVYVTTSNRDEARKIGTEMVEQKLAACANIIDGMESIYRWQDDIQTDKECILILKTTYSNVAKCTKKIKEMHSYDVPCIISINLAEQEGNAGYLDWIMQSVRKPISAADYETDD